MIEIEKNIPRPKRWPTVLRCRFVTNLWDTRGFNPDFHKFLAFGICCDEHLIHNTTLCTFHKVWIDLGECVFVSAGLALHCWEGWVLFFQWWYLHLQHQYPEQLDHHPLIYCKCCVLDAVYFHIPSFGPIASSPHVVGTRIRIKSPFVSHFKSKGGGSGVVGTGILEMPLWLMFRTREGQGCGGGVVNDLKCK